MGYWTLVLVKHDALEGLRDVPDFADDFIALCRRSRIGLYRGADPDSRFIRDRIGGAVEALMTTHAETGQILRWQGDRLESLGRFAFGDENIHALARVIARQPRSTEDQMILRSAVDGKEPPGPYEAREARDDLPPEDDILSTVLDPGRSPETVVKAESGYSDVQIRLPIRGGGWIVAELRSPWDIPGGTMEIFPVLPVPHIYDTEEEIRLRELREWGCWVDHDLHVKADSDLVPEELNAKYTRWLKRRLAIGLQTRVGNEFEMAAHINRAILVFGWLDLDPNANDVPKYPDRAPSGPSWLYEIVVLGKTSYKPAAFSVSLEEGTGRINWRLYRAIELIVRHYDPWGGDLEFRDGRVNSTRASHRTNERLDPANARNDAIEVEEELWEFFRAEMRLTEDEIRAAFELSPGATRFTALAD